MGIIAVIPARDTNKYSEQGDLSPWGNTTLLEWKISQLKSVDQLDEIVVSTDSADIMKIADKNNVSVVKRDVVEIESALTQICLSYKPDDVILWANPTSPFVDKNIFCSFIEKYFDYDISTADGVVSAVSMREFFYSKDLKKGNIDDTSIMLRDDLDELYIITNGVYMAKCKDILVRKRMFGPNPVFFDITWLASLEIKNKEQIEMFSELIHKYFLGDV